MKLKLNKIQADWPIVSIKQISRKVTDGEHATPKREDSGVLLLSARNVLNGQLDLSVVDYIPDSEYQRIIKRCHPEEGDILISCSGTIGRVCVVPKNRKFTLVRSVALVKLDVDKVSSDFVAYSLQSELLQNQMKRALNLSAQPNLFLNAINKLKLPLPKLHQQEKIVEILEAWDDAIATTEKLITAKQKLKIGYVNKFLGHFAVPKRNVSGQLDSQYAKAKLGELFKLSSGKTKPDDVLPNPSKDRPFPVLGGNGVMGYSSQSNLKGESIVIGRV